ncbi:uncharacterized protein LOC143736290 [Siphateles boraxobius]|uniref:uncharacterized protein LOC143736290 n=1 Tax=Siphateles boraxobius TaxID=180520 RepID=UPI0040640E39
MIFISNLNFKLFTFINHQSVIKGDSVSLNSDLTEMKDDDVIQWRFGDENTLIAEINVTADRITVYDVVLDGRFRDRLKLDNQTGSLTITNTRTEHDGDYVLTIYQIVNIVLLICSYESKYVMEGDSVSLNSDLAEMKDDDEIQWRFGYENTLIADINKRADSFTVYDDVLDGRFRDRLKMDHQTGSLTITNITIEEMGLYTIQINSARKRKILLRFYGEKKNVSVSVSDGGRFSPDRTEIKDDDLIQWRLSDDDDDEWSSKKTVIAEINKQAGTITVYDDVLDGRFRDRLKLNKLTGSLTITNTRTEHAGRYERKINIMNTEFFLSVFNEISVMEGDSLTLNSDFTKMMGHVVIRWRFGNENIVIAEITKQAEGITVYDDVLDGRFRDRLKLDNQTGSLTITNTTTEHAGRYKLQLVCLFLSSAQPGL